MSLSKRVLERTCYRIWAWVGSLREGLRKQGFVLDWMLSRSSGTSMTDFLNKSHLLRRAD